MTRSVLSAILLVSFACSEAPRPDDVDAAVVRLARDDRTFVEATREEFAVAMQQDLEDFEVVLDAVEARRDAALAADRVEDLERHVAEFAEGVFAVRTELDEPWQEERLALLAAGDELGTALAAAWNEVRP